MMQPLEVLIWNRDYLEEHKITNDFLQDINIADCWIYTAFKNEYPRIKIDRIDYFNGVIWFSGIDKENLIGGWLMFRLFKSVCIPVFK